MGSISGQRGHVTGSAISPDGKTLYSGSTDTTILAWDIGRLSKEPTPAPAAELASKEMETLWTDLAGTDAVQAYRSILKLASAPKQSIALLRGRLAPVLGVDAKKIDQLLADLGSSNFKTRTQATAELSALGELALPTLQKAFASPVSLEAKRRMEPLIHKLMSGTLTAGRLRVVRAVEVLDKIATPEARQIVAALAKGAPGALLTREAQAVVERIDRETSR